MVLVKRLNLITACCLVGVGPSPDAWSADENDGTIGKSSGLVSPTVQGTCGMYILRPIEVAIVRTKIWAIRKYIHAE